MGRPFKKRSLPASVRREVCLRYGPRSTSIVPVKCHFCPEVGGISWFYIEDGKAGWPATSLEFDHLVPEFHGGPTTAANLVLACRRCNRSRGHHRAIPKHVEAA